MAVLEVAGVPPRLITIAWHADRTPTAAARAFVEIVVEIGAEIAAGYAQHRARLASQSPETTIVRLLTVVGNRPQFIKSAPLSRALREAGIEEIVVHTGQHWDPTLSAVFFDELSLAEPAVTLDLRTSEVTAIEAALRETIEAVAPDDGARLRGHELHARRGEGLWSAARRARRGGAQKRRPRDARRAKQDRGRPHLDVPLRT